MKGHRFTLPPIHFSLQEAAALYVAARMLDSVSDEPNPFVARALVAPADALPAEVGHVIHEMVADRLGEERSPFARAFEVVTLGRAAERKVRMCCGRRRRCTKTKARRRGRDPRPVRTSCQTP